MCVSFIFAQVRETAQAAFIAVVLSIGISKSNHFGAQGTFKGG